MDNLSPKKRHELASKWLKNNLSPEEKQLLEEWYASDSQEPILWEKDESEVALYDRMRLNFEKRKPVKKHIAYRKALIAIAAAVLFFLAIGLYILQFKNSNHEQLLAQQEVFNIQPGSNKAVLIMEDGSEIVLDEQQSEITSGDSLFYADGKPVSENVSSHRLVASHLSLVTPVGGTYGITLPDGSHVRLNASSRLKYPSQFAADKRVVELEGEGFFTITNASTQSSENNRIPFIVKTKGQVVEVLGTQFNISAYENDHLTKTTLVEGRVHVRNAENKQSTYLEPGQQSILSNGQLTSKSIQVEPEIAWTKGLFDFQDKNLEELMNQLARWYDIEVVYQGKVPKKHFFGKLRRDNSFEEVAEILKTAGLNFQLKAPNSLIVLGD